MENKNRCRGDEIWPDLDPADCDNTAIIVYWVPDSKLSDWQAAGKPWPAEGYGDILPLCNHCRMLLDEQIQETKDPKIEVEHFDPERVCYYPG